MVLPKQKFRELVFQLLYAYDFSGSIDSDLLEMLMHELKVTKSSARLAQGKVESVVSHLAEIDEKIATASTEYQFERISRAEKNILRLGIYEICYEMSISPKIVIGEAIRLSRKFGTPESANFVNAILDSIFKGLVCASKSDSSPAVL